MAEGYFQASIVAEREGHWVLARTYAEQAKSLYEELAQHRNVGRVLNNIGGLNFLLGKAEEAVPHLKEAFRIAIDLGHADDKRLSAHNDALMDRRLDLTGRLTG